MGLELQQPSLPQCVKASQHTTFLITMQDKNVTQINFTVFLH